MKKTFLLASLMACFGSYTSYAQESIASSSVYDMVADGHHLYAATKSGVVVYDSDAKSYSIAELPDSLAGESLQSVDSKDGDVYVGLHNGHVFKLNSIDYEYVGTVPDKSLNKLRYDNDGNLYACARSLYKKTDTGWAQYTLPDSEIASTLGIYDAYADNNGNLWLAGRLMMGGAYKFDGEQISLVANNTGILVSVAANNAGQVWFGSMTKGLYYVENGTLANNFTTTNSTLKDKQISAICTDANGTMWCGSKYLHKYSDGAFTAYPMPDDVAINSLVAMNGMIYIGTTNGIYVFNGQQISQLDLGTNAINNLEEQKAETKATYTLQGIKVNSDMLRKGNVYIQGGRKIVR